MSNKYHKAIIAAIIMVRQGPQGKGKDKSSSVEFQLQQKKMTQVQKEVLADYDGRLWALCHPEKEDATPPRTTIALTFWDDKKWTRPLPINFIDTRFDYKEKDSVIEVTTFRYMMYFENPCGIYMCRRVYWGQNLSIRSVHRLRFVWSLRFSCLCTVFVVVQWCCRRVLYYSDPGPSLHAMLGYRDSLLPFARVVPWDVCSVWVLQSPRNREAEFGTFVSYLVA
jgi:hypothetical protein